LDPTLDQVNTAQPWLKARAFTAEVTPTFLRGEKTLFFALDNTGAITSYPNYQQLYAKAGIAGTMVRYTAFPNRGGYKSAPDMRRSHRRAIVERILEELAR
jgi:hypothetical protein